MVAGELAVGGMLGAWRIEREIGRGGMAIVYLGERGDGEFHKKVAVKLIRRGMDTAGVIARLRRERRILAALDHPYIARLLDGGSTTDGSPYIVMEFVEGVPIDRYCDQRRLSIEERCLLTAKVCQAVAFAHRNLVIHRDLKPGNILVDAHGDPKLLDFGIAKVLSSEEEDEAGTLTRGPERPRTPGYASPEQLAGGVMGTATDVYSLGVVLYELLAGVRPGGNDRRVGAAAARNGKDRKWSKRLEGDLDNILQAALRDEPERRYPSVERLERDLGLHLAGMPVEARGESAIYRCGKFLRRHRVGALAASLVAASLIGGMATTLWQARRAAEEKQIAEARQMDAERQREIARREAATSAAAERRAEAEQAEAEAQRAASRKRLTELLGLAKTSLFDVQDTLERVPGALDARKELIATTVRYLDGLSAGAQDDLALLHLLGTGYTEVGDVLGLAERPNLGDRAGALAACAKARLILERAEKLQPNDLTVRLQDLGLHQRVGMAEEAVGDLNSAVMEYRAALQLAEFVATQDSTNAKTRSQPGIMELALDAVAITVPGRILCVVLRQCPVLPPTIAERIRDYRAQTEFSVLL
jgi:tRNA A-37 threonylcarbamoyl transferase component Bud32